MFFVSRSVGSPTRRPSFCSSLPLFVHLSVLLFACSSVHSNLHHHHPPPPRPSINLLVCVVSCCYSSSQYHPIHISPSSMYVMTISTPLKSFTRTMCFTAKTKAAPSNRYQRTYTIMFPPEIPGVVAPVSQIPGRSHVSRAKIYHIFPFSRLVR